MDHAMLVADQYKELIGLHQFYFQFLLTGTQFYLGITGALVAYCVRSGMRGSQMRVVMLWMPNAQPGCRIGR